MNFSFSFAPKKGASGVKFCQLILIKAKRKENQTNVIKANIEPFSN